MKTVLGTAALALAIGLGATMLAAAPASAAGCIRQAALDLNGDGWVDTAEFHMAMDAGFQNIRSPGKQYLSEEDMNRCLQGSETAFRWLQSANPRYVSYMGPAPTPIYATAASSYSSPYPNPTRYYSAYDAGAAYDTPTPQAHAAALDYLRAKVYGNPAYDASAAGRSTYQPQPPTYYAPVVPQPQAQAYASNSAPMPAPQYSYKPVPAAEPNYPMLSSEFSQMDVNNDGVVSRDEFMNYMIRAGRTY